MRKVIIVVGLVVLGLAAPGSAGAVPPDRVDEGPYEHPDGFTTENVTVINDDAVVEFEARPGERLVSMTIDDEVGDAVVGHLHIDRDGDGELEVSEDFCGSTLRPYRVTAGSRISVSVLGGVCNGAPAPATRGVVIATFSK